MSEMVERVAQALCVAQPSLGTPNGMARELAIAAIKAMRVPTQRMVAVGRRGHDQTVAYDRDCFDTWRDMIDEALK